MFTTKVRGGKAFAAEQDIRERKSRISKLKAISDKNKAKIPPTTINKQSGEIMNDVKSEKEIEKKSLTSEQFKMLFNFGRIKRSKKISDRLTIQ